MTSVSWIVAVILVTSWRQTKACGGTLTGSTGQITSPNYPNNYNSDVTCTYNIIPSSSSLIRLVFVDFETEGGYDYVKVFNSSDVQVAHVTGSRSGTVVQSAFSYKVVLKTDRWTTRRGFRATWSVASSTTVNPEIGLHTKCTVNYALTLVNTTGTKVKVYEKVLLPTSAQCHNTCLLLPSCTHCKYEAMDLCTLYDADPGASVTLTDVFLKV